MSAARSWLVAGFAIVAMAGLVQQAEGYLQRGVELLATGRVDEAIAELEQAVAMAPEDPRGRYQLGLALFTARRPEAAVEHLRAALRRSTETGAIHFLLGQVLLETGDLQDAGASLQAAARSRPDYPPIDFYLAELCYRLGRVDSARDAFADLAAADPSWTAPRVRSGVLALEQGETAEAVGWLTAVVDAAPGDPIGWMRLASALVEDEQADQALAAYREAVSRAPESVPARVAVAMQLINLGEDEMALAAVDAALALDPGHGAMRFQRAKLLFRSGRHDDALGELQTALGDIEPRPGPAGGDRWRNEAELLLAETLLEVGRDEEALVLARRIVNELPDYPEALFFLGNALIRRGDPEGQDVLRRFRTLSEAREQRELGDQLRLREGAPERALAAYEAALDLVADDPVALLGLASAQRQTGSATAAIDSLAAARRAGDVGEEWYREWVLALFDVERSDDARSAWREARARGLRLGPRVWALIYQSVAGC